MPLTIEQIKQISPKTLLTLINRAKKYLKTNSVFKEMCEEYKVKPDIIDQIPIRFGDLDVSARTSKGVIVLNYKLLCDGDFLKDYHYLQHEILHYLQMTCRNGPTKGSADGDYLSNPDEEEAFQYQIKYIDETHGKNKAEEYVEHVLDHHDKNNKERKDIKEDLMELVDNG